MAVRDRYILQGQIRFTLADRKRLDQLLQKYAPNGCRRLQNEAQSARRSVGRAEPSAKDIVRRKFLETHEVLTEEDAVALNELRDKAHRAVDIEVNNDSRWALDRAVSDGMLSERDAQLKYAQYTRDQLNEVRKLTRELTFALGEQSALQTFGATATQDDLNDVADRWAEHSRFAKAKAEFQEQLAACKSIEEKAELRAAFSEFLEA